MELRNDQARRHQARLAQPGPERTQADLANAKAANEAHLRSTVDRVAEGSRETASNLRGAAEGSGDSIQFSRLAQQVAENDEQQAARRERLDELRRTYESGKLNDRPRLARAAERLLNS